MKKQLAILLALILASTAVSCTSAKVNDGESTNGNGESESTSETETETGGTVSEDIEPFDYMSEDLTPYVKVSEYKGLKASKESPDLTDEEFESAISNLLENHAYNTEITDRNVEEGDTVVCDYSGYLDGVQFEGGTATNTQITAAPNTGMIEGFAEAFVGKTPGEEFEFEVTFPDNYTLDPTMSGKTTKFVCTVHYIVGDVVIPELTDEFVNENYGYSNVDEFRIAYRASVQSQKEEYVLNGVYTSLWTQITENSEILKYPEDELNRLYNERRQYYEAYAKYYGVDYDTFLANYAGVTDEDIVNECKNYVKEDLIMYQLIKELDVKLTEEEYAAKREEYADLIAYYGEDTINATIMWQALMTKIAEFAEITVE